MKHIAIIPNYSGVTDLIKSGELNPNFLVKSQADNKVYYSNAEGYYIIAGGQRYNMYKEGVPLIASFSSTHGFSFQLFMTGDESAMTLDCDVAAYLSNGTTTVDSIEETQESASTFEIYWENLGDTSWEVFFYPPGTQGGPLLQILGTYTMTEQETCEYNGCTWNDETQECECSCESQGLCDDGEGNCVECDPCAAFDEGTEERCNCEGRYWWDDECHDEPEDPCQEDPCSCDPNPDECRCNEEGRYWYDDDCHDEPQEEE